MEPRLTQTRDTPKTKSQSLKLSILEKPEGEVSYLWKGCQLLTYIVCITSGFCTSLAIGSVMREFNDCVLYANLSVEVIVLNNTFKIPSTNSWSDVTRCNFCQYAPVASVIFAGIWATFFMMCGRGGSSKSNLPQAWRIVPLALLVGIAFVVISSITVGYIFGGFSTFCSYLIANMNKIEGVKISSCDELAEYSWEGHTPGHFYKQVLIAEISSVITLLGWIAGFILLLVRCATHADFQVLSEEEEMPQSETTQLSTAKTSPEGGLTPTRDQNPLILVEVSK